MAKFVTAQEAVQYIHSGDRVALAHSVGEPQALVNAMLDNDLIYFFGILFSQGAR